MRFLNSNLDAMAPMLCLTLGALAAMAAEAFRRKGERMPIGWFGIIVLAGAGLSAGFLWDRNLVAFDVIVADNFGLFVTFVLVVVGLLTVAFSSQVIHRDGLPAGEYYALVLFSIAGMMMMAMATDLLVIFIALEILSLAVYVLTGIRRDTLAGTEAAFKYFLLGAFSSAFFLYGIAFTYGVTGSTRLTAVGAYLSAQSMTGNPMILIALGLLLVGFSFKISAVPFHMWTPDAYEGAPAIVTGFMSTGVKAAAFAAFVRVFLSSFEPFRVPSPAGPGWADVVAAIAIATMVLGTIVGVAQSSLKRMLAYSSIAHGGYLLIGLVAGNQVGKASILFYLLVYSVTNLAAFGVIAMLGARDKPNDSLRDYAGLWHSRPALAALMTVCLLSLGGLPPTAGFIGKWYIFSAAVSAGYYTLAIIGVLTSVISVFFYLRVVVMMYMSDRDTAHAPAPITPVGMAALSLAIVAIFVLGILPTPVLNLATRSIATIF
ncbi:MAG TPA: NADH-quinone oxidoreductase subunit N [Vicinamibacterales bacterium]|jgi:NADH-quinone oxidoreductase subunit N|nr:NADH-quinone oxidoreductase subunit N [Vicinamibacterales bacterium]